MISAPRDRVQSSETPYQPVELTSRIALKVAISPLQRLRWMRVAIMLIGHHTVPLMVAVILAEKAGGGKSWPSLQTLAKEIGKSRPTVGRATLRLEALGLLQRTQRFNNSTVYLLTFPPNSEPVKAHQL